MRKAVRGHMIQTKYLLDVRPHPMHKQGLLLMYIHTLFKIDVDTD